MNTVEFIAQQDRAFAEFARALVRERWEERESAEMVLLRLHEFMGQQMQETREHLGVDERDSFERELNLRWTYHYHMRPQETV